MQLIIVTASAASLARESRAVTMTMSCPEFLVASRIEAAAGRQIAFAVNKRRFERGRGQKRRDY